LGETAAVDTVNFLQSRYNSTVVFCRGLTPPFRKEAEELLILYLTKAGVDKIIFQLVSCEAHVVLKGFFKVFVSRLFSRFLSSCVIRRDGEHTSWERQHV